MSCEHITNDFFYFFFLFITAHSSDLVAVLQAHARRGSVLAHPCYVRNIDKNLIQKSIYAFKASWILDAFTTS